jgi:stearoyl-CoA desaturase (delta-9 desaturase)
MPWWEIDLTYYGLRLLAAVGLVWDLRDNQVPAAADKLTEEPSRPLRVA